MISERETDNEVKAIMESAPRFLSQVICPHCWERFPPEEILWTSEHVDLLGDPLLGPERQRRFLASRFTIDGDAIDARGMTCRTLACPKCHLPVPRAMLEMESLFISILGAPASGKSYFLAAMAWQLCQTLPKHFKVSFTDADPASNRSLIECEQSLFLHPNESRLIPLGSLIRKTELQGELYGTVAYGQQAVSYPRPFLFAMQPCDGHPGGEKASIARMLCLYDNAGEHFQPGHDTTSSPVTRHVARSRAILFLFDPTQDRRFRAACRSGNGLGGSIRHVARRGLQETILNEAALRIRRYAGLSQSAKFAWPMIFVISKFDECSHLLSLDLTVEPWRVQGNVTGVDVEQIDRVSGRLRDILLHFCPETVAAAETLAREVTYVAVSSLGEHVVLDPDTRLPGIRPKDIHPRWVTVPLLYAMSRVVPSLVPRFIRRAKRSSAQ